MVIQEYNPALNNGRQTINTKGLKITKNNGDIVKIIFGVNISHLALHEVRNAGIIFLFDNLCSMFTILKNRYGVCESFNTINSLNINIIDSLIPYFTHYEIAEIIIKINDHISEMTGVEITYPSESAFGFIRIHHKIKPLQHLNKHKFTY